MNYFQQLFRRYQQDRISESEKQLVEGWYDFYDQEPDPLLTSIEAAEIKNSLWQKLSGSVQAEQAALREATIRRLWLRYSSIAALLLIGTTLWYLFSRPAPSAKVFYTEYSTAPNITRQLTLPDGSIIWLRPGSKVRIENNFGKDTLRKLFMGGGEIYCEIARDTSHPFVIYTDELQVRVLGTSFTVKAIPGIKKQEVIVNTGKVSVQDPSHLLSVLTPGQQLQYNTFTDSAQVFSGRQLLASQLQYGWLVLDNHSVADLKTILKARFDVTLQDPQQLLKHAHFSAAFSSNTSIDAMMQVLCAVQGVKYKYSNKTIFIYK